MLIRRLAEEGRLSGAVVAGGFVWLAGQVADDATLDAEGQTADILRQVDALLAEAGTDKRALVSVTVVLADNALTGWRTVDANGGRTSVLLSGVETGAKLNPRLFILKDFDNR